MATILGAIRYCPERVAALVGLYIASAYWFTASTSFANPAVTIARALSDSFAGIAPHSAPAFNAAQIAAAVAANISFGWLFGRSKLSDGRSLGAG
jgi:glycerol uptake facilitator-like aquaporin